MPLYLFYLFVTTAIAIMIEAKVRSKAATIAIIAVDNGSWASSFEASNQQRHIG